jgi:hypothetical protein
VAMSQHSVASAFDLYASSATVRFVSMPQVIQT